MGIEKLLGYIRKNCKESIYNIPLEEFENETISIDTTLWLYKSLCITKDNWLDYFIRMICLFKKFKIKPIFIYDGVAPIEKAKTKLLRKENRDKIKKKYLEYMKILEFSDTLDYHNLTEKEDCNLEYQDIKNLSLDYVKEKKILFSNAEKEEIREYIIKLEKQVINITEKHINTLKKLVKYFGYQFIIAKEESETLCSSLCVYGKVDAVLSEDSDSLVYGSKKLLTYIDFYNYTFECIDHEKLLKELDLDSIQFIDFCILCGNDYNDKIPQYGIKRSLDIIKKYGNIDKIINNEKVIKEIEKKYKYPFTIKNINYMTSRRLFKPRGHEEVKIKNINQINLRKINNIILINNSNVSLEYISKHWQKVEIKVKEENKKLKD